MKIKSRSVQTIDNYDYLVPNGYYGNDSHKMVKMASLKLLKTQNLTRQYGGITAVNDVDFNFSGQLFTESRWAHMPRVK